MERRLCQIGQGQFLSLSKRIAAERPERQVMYGFKSLKISVAAFLALGFLGLASAPAMAQAVCGKRSDIIRQLQKKYGETRRSVGVQQGRGVVEVYASSDTGSWTILITNARGLSCLMAAGEAFEALIENTSDTGSPI